MNTRTPFRAFLFGLFRKAIIALHLAGAVGCLPLVNLPGKPANAPRLGFSHFVAGDGAVLPARAWLPAGPVNTVLVAVHGFNDYSNFFAAPGRFLSQRGIACYAYDQRGFGNAPGRGLWSGIGAYSRDLTDFTAAVRRRHPRVPVYILGESMGGAVVIVAATGPDPPNADGLVLAAPAVWARNTMPWYQRLVLSAGVHTVPWLRLTGEGLGILPSDNIEMLRGLGRDPLVIKATRIDAVYGLANLMDEAMERVGRLQSSTLVLYGERDQIIPKEPVFRMLEKLPPGPRIRAAFYEHGYHMLLRDLGAEAPLRDIAAWLGDRDAPLPSGADERVPPPLQKAGTMAAAPKAAHLHGG